MKRGLATMPLDTGRVPKWLFERMVCLTRDVAIGIVKDYGPDEFIARISDPVWFQCLSCLIGMDWNSSGTTTITTGALKQGLRGIEKDLGIFICGGKGKTSRKTPDEIINWADRLSLPEPNVNALVYNSKMAAKVDSSLIQDSYQIYHHSFFFSYRKGACPHTKREQGAVGAETDEISSRYGVGAWAVIQQGMNIQSQTARRYHWYSKNIKDLIEEPHSGIATQRKEENVLNLTAKESGQNREVSTGLISQNFNTLMKDIKLLRKYYTPLSQMMEISKGPACAGRQQRLKFLNLEAKEYNWHPVVIEDFSKSKYLEKILWRLCDQKPENYEKLLATEGVGPKTIRALALVSEIIYGAKPSYEDPARYSFAHGGKDATPYPVDRPTYDQTIEKLKGFLKR